MSAPAVESPPAASACRISWDAAGCSSTSPIDDPRVSGTRTASPSTSTGAVERMSRLDAPTSRETVPTTVVLVVDHSRSMEAEDRIGALKEAVRTFLGVMPAGSRVAVVAFSDEIRVIRDFSTDVGEIQRAVDALQPTGGTRYYDAVVEALELISGEPGRKAVLALTDGELGDTLQFRVATTQKILYGKVEQPTLARVVQ